MSIRTRLADALEGLALAIRRPQARPKLLVDPKPVTYAQKWVAKGFVLHYPVQEQEPSKLDELLYNDGEAEASLEEDGYGHGV